MVASRERRPPITKSDSSTERFQIRKDIRELKEEGIEKITNEDLHILISRTILALRNSEKQSSFTGSIQITSEIKAWEENRDVILDNPTKDKRIIFSKDEQGKVNVSAIEGIHKDNDRRVTTNGITFNDKKQLLLDLFTALTAPQKPQADLQNFRPVPEVLPFSPPVSPSQPRLIP